MRKIIHVDMDCFYAAVEEKHNPALKGKPVGIGGPPNSRSVLCTANYEARKFGVKAAIPSSQAMRLCPHLILVPPHFDLYKKESQAVRQILERFTQLIEPLSLDEAYLDVTDSQHFLGSATLIAKEIKRLVRAETGLTISAGVAPNKFLAKVASDWQKPDGLFTIAPHQVNEFIKHLPIEKIFGVGKVTAQQLHLLGIKTCLDLQNYPDSSLSSKIGSRAHELKLYAHGIDDRPVRTSFERKSVNVEETFNIDKKNLEEALRELPELFQDWLLRMERGHYVDRIKSLQVKLKFTDFQQTTLEQVYTETSPPNLKHFELLLRRAWDRRGDPVRLIGLGAKLKTSSASQNPEQMPQNTDTFVADEQLQFSLSG